MVSDTVMTRPVPEEVRKSVAVYIGCVSGALMKNEDLSMLRAAGFEKAEILKESSVDFASACRDLGLPIDKKPEELAGIIEALDKSILSITVAAFRAGADR